MFRVTDFVENMEIVIGMKTDLEAMCHKTLERIILRQELLGQKLEPGHYIARAIVGAGNTAQ